MDTAASVSRGHRPLWLGEADGDATALLRPLPADRLRIWPVERTVNNVRNDGPELLVPCSLLAEQPILVEVERIVPSPRPPGCAKTARRLHRPCPLIPPRAIMKSVFLRSGAAHRRRRGRTAFGAAPVRKKRIGLNQGPRLPMGFV
jgi:hypothetical protein